MNVAGPEMAPRDAEATVNLLQEELEATNREVMLLTLELEQRVAERTSELAQSNQKLIREVAERIRAEAEIKKLNRDLENRAALLKAANEELEAFSSSVSHDLRNPLSRILGFASLLEDDPEKVPVQKRRKYASQICDSGRKMAALIDDLLRLSHSSQGALVWSTVDLNKLVAEVIEELKTDAGSKNVEWICGSLPTVPGDESLLRQVCVNLLGNALKYSRKQSRPRIEIQEGESSPDEWTIFVRDNGVGFDSSKKEKLFGAFQRLHNAQEFEGTGIGLVNVKRIVLRHGGRVWAESNPGDGAIFYVSLPKAARPITEKGKRRMRRISFRRKISVRFASEIFEAETVNLSLSGMLVKASRVFPPGSQVYLTFEIAEGEEPFTTRGSVARIVGSDQMGIHVEAVDAVNLGRLTAFFSRATSESH
jgi:signal transduction histidine kinase